MIADLGITGDRMVVSECWGLAGLSAPWAARQLLALTGRYHRVQVFWAFGGSRGIVGSGVRTNGMSYGGSAHQDTTQRTIQRYAHIGPGAFDGEIYGPVLSRHGVYYQSALDLW